MKKLTVVIDTNIFVKALMHTPSAQDIYRLFRDETFKLAISENMLKEIEEVIARPKFNFPAHKTNRMIEIIKELAVIAKPKAKSLLCRDPEDNMLIEAAITAKAEYIITSDKDLLEIPRNKLKFIKIVSPAKFLEIFPEKE